MSSYEQGEIGQVSAEDLVGFCRVLDVLKPLCLTDTDIPDRVWHKRKLADGRIAEVSITVVEADIPTLDDPEVIESIDKYTIYSLHVAEDSISDDGKGTRIKKHYSVFEPDIAPEGSFEETDTTYYLTNDFGANWHLQRNPLIDKKVEADIHADHGEYEEAAGLQVEINAARSRARDLAEMLGEGPNSRTRYLAAMAVVSEIRIALDI